jgi:hypothetical protein
MSFLNNSGNKKIGLIKVTVFIISLLIGSGFGSFFAPASKLKTDQQMIEEFQAKKDKLNQLIRMIKEDNQLITRSEISLTAEGLRKKGVKESRIQEYEQVWQDLNINDGKFYLSYQIGRVCMRSASEYEVEGDASKKVSLGNVKGFCWVDDNYRPTETVNNLEKYYSHFFFTSRHQYGGIYFRELEGNWYLYLEKSAEAV